MTDTLQLEFGAQQSVGMPCAILKSVYDTNDDILLAIMQLHCPSGFDCDMTYGNGAFWTRIPRPRFCYDITPLHECVIRADSKTLPLPPSSIDNCVFDPPFLTYVTGGREHNSKVTMTSRFGGY